MNLPVSHSESLTIKPFGSSTGNHQECKIINLCIGTVGSEDVMLSAICDLIQTCWTANLKGSGGWKVLG